MQNRIFPVLFFFTAALVALAAFSPTNAAAQGAIPEMPEPIQNLANEGAQIRYLGRDYGYDGWLTVKNGQEQYFYVKPDGSAFVMGVLFDDKGNLVTVDQVQRLRKSGDDVLDSLSSANGFDLQKSRAAQQKGPEFKSPSERLYYEIENSNWIPFGKAGAPVLYSFMDPQCPHCHALVNDLRDGLMEQGKVQLRMIPVGFKEETRSQAAFMMASPDPAARFLRHLDGDETALPAKDDINTQGVERNLALMQSWKLDVTPVLIYRGKDGTVKLVRGRPQDLQLVINDLGSRK